MRLTAPDYFIQDRLNRILAGLWAATGVSYRELIDHLVDLALARHERRSAHHDTQR